VITRAEAKDLREEAGTPGGTTYWVRKSGEREFKALCFRPLHGKPEERCSNGAGYDTWHSGNGACKFHGGATQKYNVVTGRNATVNRERLRTQIDNYLSLDRKKLLDLSYELAVSKAIFDESIETFPEVSNINYGFSLARFLKLLESMGNLVEKISKIDSRDALTAAQVLYLRATVADIMMKYITDPITRERAAKELASRLGGEVQHDVELEPNEYSLPGKL
jgi:hypothetical protein